jgi:hypothetical protein
MSQNCYKGIEFELLIKMRATKTLNLWSFREKKKFYWQKNIHLLCSKLNMLYGPKIVGKELSLIFFSRCGPLRAGICGVLGRNKGSAGRKIFFCSSAKLTCAEIQKLPERN